MTTKKIVLAGVGGQGILFSGKILGQLALRSGYDVKIGESHGMAQRGGSVVTFIVYGEKIYAPIIEEGEADILLAFGEMEAIRYSSYLKENGYLIYNRNKNMDSSELIYKPPSVNNRIMKKNSYKIFSIESDLKAKRLEHTLVSNMILLGYSSRFMEFSLKEWIDVIKDTVSLEKIKMNKEAFRIGYESSLADSTVMEVKI